MQRREDARFLTGKGRYAGDIKSPNAAHLAFRRSDHAHARIVGVDATAALELPGVIGAYVAADLYDLVSPPRAASKTPGFVSTPVLPLADGKVRHVGEPVVALLAESRHIAEDAAELVQIDLEPLPAALDPAEAAETGAPLLHEDAGTNVLVDRSLGHGDVDEAFARAAVSVGGHFRMTRTSAAPMEGRACVADWDAGRRTLTFHSATQMPGVVRDTIATVFGLPGPNIRVIAPDVGGAFGAKGCLYPDEMCACALSIKTGRPVKWVSDRMEDLLSTYQAFDEHVDAYLAVDGEGRFLGLRAEAIGDVGAYSIYPWTAAMEPVQVVSFLPGPYRVPAYRGRTRAVATPKTPMGAYRGVGRPTAAFVMERLIDMAARELGLDPVEIRRRNMIRQDEFPYKSVSGIVWDRAAFLDCLEAATEKSGYASLRQMQDEARAEGRLVGIGVASYAELTGLGSRIPVAPGMPVNTGVEAATVRIDPTGGVVATFGMGGQGQGHETTLAQIVADALGCAFEDVSVQQGDSGSVAQSTGTFASRGTILAGGSAMLAARVVRQNVLKVAAILLEVSEEDLVLEASTVHVPGTDRMMTLRTVASAFYRDIGKLPKESREEFPLEATGNFDPYFGTTSAATHMAVVEVDPVTCGVEILKYIVAEDSGKMVNPMIVEGQIRGGVAQGIGAALMEEIVHDEDGQMLTASFVDYLVPSAGEIPLIDIVHIEAEPANNMTGFRGAGEGGTIGAPAAIANAVSDALRAHNGHVATLPVTPERIHQILRSATA